MEHTEQKHRIRRRGLYEGFRFLLWWGMETFRPFVRPAEVKKEVRAHGVSDRWPAASWHWIENRPCCLIHPDQRRGVRIAAFPETSMN